MCGIVGLISREEPFPARVLQEMTDAIAHRGPDGQGVRIHGKVGLGHRRLSIIDLAGGHQPMSNEDGSISITFNGEVYNFKELMHQLQCKGHQFKTRSDTEVVIHAWEEWGEACVEHFRGMFAFGIADYRQGCLFLARDHFGIKPLVYCQTEEAFAFCSELGPLTRTPGFDGSLDLEAIDQYLWLQYIPAPSSAYRQMGKLGPAQWMRVDFAGRAEVPRRYWSLRFNPIEGRSADDWEEYIASVVKESVNAHLMSDVPFGAFLSGGVDSSLIVANMSTILSNPVQTFSIGFREEEYDETRYAAFAAETCGTTHTRGEMGSGALDLLPDLVRHCGEPFGDSSILPTWHVSRLARASVAMVLSGDGADEFFGGYWSHGAWMDSPSGEVADWIKHIEYTSTPVRAQLWRPEFAACCQPRLELFDRLWTDTEGMSELHRVQQMDVNTYLPFDILTKVDTASMMHGLEARTPFVDLKVAGAASQIPADFAMVRGGDGTWNRKALLKKVARRFFPETFLNRPKMGFSMPVQKWFSPGSRAYPGIVDKLLGRDSALSPYFDPEAIKGILSRSATGSIWLLVFLAEWLRQQNQSPLSRRERCVDLTNIQEVRRAPLPEVPAADARPRVLIIADSPSWIYDRYAHILQRGLRKEFEIEIAYQGQPVIEPLYDLIHPLEWNLVSPEVIHAPAKWVTGVRSFISWRHLEPRELGGFLSQAFGSTYVVSRRLQDLLRPSLPDVVLLQHGVDMDFYTPSSSMHDHLEGHRQFLLAALARSRSGGAPSNYPHWQWLDYRNIPSMAACWKARAEAEDLAVQIVENGHRRTVVSGATQLGYFVTLKLRSLGVEVIALADRNAPYPIQTMLGVPVIRLEQSLDLAPDAVIIAAVRSSKAIQEEIRLLSRAAGRSEPKIFSFPARCKFPETSSLGPS